MNETLALPPRLVLRDLMLTAFSQKARIALIFFCIIALSIVIAVQVQPDYKSKSTMAGANGHRTRVPSRRWSVDDAIGGAGLGRDPAH